MSGPIIPLIDLPELDLTFLQYLPLVGDSVDPADPPSIKPFGTLVAIGVYVGSWLTMRRARERGLEEQRFSDFIFWVVATGFVISHVLDAIFYHPETVAQDPTYLLRIWEGLSSFGGLIGAVIGALAWSYYRKTSVIEYIDVTASCFPIAWVFGRTGCSVVHDHPGMTSNAWYAVSCEAVDNTYSAAAQSFCRLPAGFEGRLDLGLIEMVLSIPLALACIVLWRRKPLRANGFYSGMALTAYAPVRFVLDFYRVSADEKVIGADPRYWGLTWAQWVCIGALALGLYLIKKTRGQPYVRVAVAAGALDDDGRVVDDDDDDDAPESERPRKRRKKRGKKKASAKPGTSTGSAKKKARKKERAAKKAATAHASADDASADDASADDASADDASADDASADDASADD